MPFALTFAGDIDPTALATFVLALLTLASVVVGGKALRKAQGEIDISRREVEEAHRPVLIPIIDETKKLELWDASTVRPVRPYFMDASRVVLPIKNIGSGPALSIDVSVTPRNDAGDYSDAWGDAEHRSTIVGLGVSELTPIAVYIPRLGDLPTFDVTLTYLDVAGKEWVTSAKFVKDGGGRYTNLSITATHRFVDVRSGQGETSNGLPARPHSGRRTV